MLKPPTPFMADMKDSLAPFLQRVNILDQDTPSQKNILKTFALAKLERLSRGFSMTFYEEVVNHDEIKYFNPLQIRAAEF